MSILPLSVNLLNKFLLFNEAGFVATKLMPVLSGQKHVYHAVREGEKSEDYVIKLGFEEFKKDIPRLLNEIKFVSNLNSIHFPEIAFSLYSSKERINAFLDYLDATDLREWYKAGYPSFVLVIERFIQHIDPKILFYKFHEDLSSFFVFFKRLFNVMTLVWDKGYVHRDLKWANVLIQKDFSPIVIDFGGAKDTLDKTSLLTSKYETAPLTLLYASPEQMKLFGFNNEVDWRSDQFSIGVMIYYCLTEKYPYCDFPIDQMILQQNVKRGKKNNYLDAWGKSDDLILFVNKLIEPRAFNRFDTHQELLLEFERIENLL